MESTSVYWMNLFYTLTQDRNRYVQRMQKAMVQMNLMLVNVVDSLESLESRTGKAIVATCRKLSMAFYNTIVFGQDYVEEGNKKYKERLANREKALLEKLAKKHNVTLLPTSAHT